MITHVAERPRMARRSNDVSAKIDAKAMEVARLVAEIRGITVAEYVSEVVKEQATKELDAWAAARVNEAKSPKAPKKPRPK